MASLDGLLGFSSAPDDMSAQSWAWYQLRRYTFDRVMQDDVPDEMLAECFEELVTFRQRLNQNGGRLPTSESVDKWSRSFSSTANDVNAAIRDIITRQLGHTDLLYRGLD